MGRSMDRAQSAYDNMVPDEPPCCPDCGCDLEDGECPAANAYREWEQDLSGEVPEPDYMCEWVMPEEDDDWDRQYEEEKERRWDDR